MSFLLPQMAHANYPHLCATLHLCRLFSKCWETDHHVCFHSCVRASPLTGLGRTICVFSEKFATNSEFKTLKRGLSGMFSHLCGGCQRGAGMQRPEGQVGGLPQPSSLLGQLPWSGWCAQPRLLKTKPENFPEKKKKKQWQEAPLLPADLQTGELTLGASASGRSYSRWAHRGPVLQSDCEGLATSRKVLEDELQHRRSAATPGPQSFCSS